MKVLTTAQMQDVDRRTIQEIGVPGVVLMENAGRAVAEEVVRRFADRQSLGALVLAGRGNNGGDGYVIARSLMDKGWLVKTVILVPRDAIKGDAAVNLAALEKCGGAIFFASDQEELERVLLINQTTGVLIDALFGTGLSKPVTDHYAVTIDWINDQLMPVVAVDIPSGIDASTGKILGKCVAADLTVSFAFPKIGQVSYPGAGSVGELVTVDIGIPRLVTEQTLANCFLIGADEAKSLVPTRSLDGHKGTFGHLLVLAGSQGKSGAAIMAAESGLRGGAGLVTLACPQSVQSVVATRLVEVMTAPLTDFGGEISLQAREEVSALLADKQALAIGPGLGVGEEVRALVRHLVQETGLPIVVDADGLTALSGHLEVLSQRQDRLTVLTPHPGEMSRLCGLSTQEIQANRFTIARDFAVCHQVVLVLKGARTLIACPDGRVNINTGGHVGLASGGMGDVLTGLIGSLLSQGLTAEKAATLAVYLHGSAADRLLPRFGNAGLLATDVMCELPAARYALTQGGSHVDC